MTHLIVVPTYNEEENISELLNKIFILSLPLHVLFVDDGSRDKTVSIIKSHKEFGHKIQMIERPCKMGLGSAYITGFKWALAQNKYESVCEMDADLSHNPNYLPDMINLLKSYDVVIGSRYVANGGVENWSLLRRLLSRFGSWYARTILSLDIKDLTGGFNLWKINVLSAIQLDKVKSEGYSFQIELKYRAEQKKFRIVEFPIIFVDRIAGQSKMSFKICIEAFYRVLQLRLKKKE